MAKNVNAHKGSGGGFASFLTQYDVARGYADAIAGEVWPDDPSQMYEWGRYIGAEVRLLEGEKAPRKIPYMQRVTKEWRTRMSRLSAYNTLVLRHYARDYHRS